jgi:hypothetical protein
VTSHHAKRVTYTKPVMLLLFQSYCLTEDASWLDGQGWALTDVERCRMKHHGMSSSQLVPCSRPCIVRCVCRCAGTDGVTRIECLRQGFTH